MNRYEQVLTLCSKNVWDVHDIRTYEDCGRTTAYKLRKDALTNGKAKVPFFPNLVNVDKYLAYRYDTSREREIQIAKLGLYEPKSIISLTNPEGETHDPKQVSGS